MSAHHGCRRSVVASAAAAAWAVLGLAACAPTLPLMPEPIDCPLPAALQAQTCAEPTPLADGLTYGDVIAAAIDDRKALRACAAHDRLLSQTLQECNAAIAQYRVQIRSINAAAGAKP